MDNYKIYKYTSPSGGVYIGQTKKTIDRRATKNGTGYLAINKKTGKYAQPGIANAIIKYGWKNFKKEILFEGLTKEDADRIETEQIAYYRSKGTCYNIANGGEGLSGVNENPMKAYYLNGEFFKQYPSILSATDDLNLDPHAEANISACCLGRKHRAYGYIWRYVDSDLEVKPLKRYRESICQFTKDWKYIATYDNIAHAHRETLICENSIGNVLNGRAKTAGGYNWKFTNDVKHLIPNETDKEIDKPYYIPENHINSDSISLF